MRDARRKTRENPGPDDGSKKIMDYWAPSQKMMGDKGFIPRLKEYDKDNIPAKIMKTIRTTRASESSSEKRDLRVLKCGERLHFVDVTRVHLTMT